MWIRRLAITTLIFVVAAAGTASADIFDKLKKIAQEVVEEEIDDSMAESTPQTLPPKGLDLLSSDTQNCRGRWGLGCNSMFDGMENPAYVEYPCDGDSELVCIKSQMSIGAIKHDRCCDIAASNGVTGHFCSSTKMATAGKAVCEEEWDQAKLEWARNEKFPSEWKYKVGANPTNESSGWWVRVAPDETKVSQSNPMEDEVYCASGHVAQKNGTWVCSPKLETREFPAQYQPNIPEKNQPNSGNSTSESTGSLEVYGIRLGMTSSDVIAALRSRNPDQKYGIKETPCFDDAGQCAHEITAYIHPTDGEELSLKIRLFPDLPPNSKQDFVAEIIFMHKFQRLGFDPVQFVTEKYGVLRGNELASPPSFRNEKTKLSVNSYPSSRRIAGFLGYYIINHRWGVSRKNYMRDFGDAKARQKPASDKPF